jgi:putative transposase
MNEVYRYTGYFKQSFHQRINRLLRIEEQHLLLLPVIAELRQEHPGVGARQLYRIIKPLYIGRDRFEKLCFDYGFKLDRPKAYKRTTNSSGVIRFANLIEYAEFTRINQAWSSDITYYQIGEQFYYITFIIDLFSRKITGFSVSNRLLTELTTLPALQMALKQRAPAPGLIFHSDGGGQYYSKEFLKLTQAHQVNNSMCDVVYENAHAERVNGTIKNQYLKGYAPADYQSLVSMTAKAVKNYNKVRPHKSLLNKSPDDFEQSMPVGDFSLANDIFCSLSNKPGLYQKKHHSPMRLTVNLITDNSLQKTVNVF